MWDQHFGWGRPRGEYSHQSFCSKVCNSVCGVLFGLILFPCALYLIWWNEQNAVCTAKAYTDAVDQTNVFTAFHEAC